MRTTIDIPEELIKNAMKLSNARSKTKVIILALEELIRRKRIEELINLRGTVKLNVDLKKSRRR